MNAESPASLPWEELNCQDGDVPWSALRTFANAVVVDRELIPRLFDLYDRAYEALSDDTGVADLLVAGILAMAAPRLDESRRREIGSLLIERLVQAGRDGADLSMEVLTAAVGTMGPVILPALFDAIAREPDTKGAWYFLWTLTLLAAKTDDEDLRSRAIRECAELLERIDRGQTNPVDGVQAAWTLATLQCTQYTDLIERQTATSSPSFFAADYEDALKFLQGRLEFTPSAELWEEPVEQWLAPRCGGACTWEDDTDDYEDEYFDETEVLDNTEDQHEDKDRMRARLMAASFCYSPVAAAMPRELRDHASFIVEELLYSSFVHLDLAPARWDESAMRELLLDIVPRKLLANVGVLEMVVPVTEAFLYWLQFEGFVPGIAVLTQTIHGWTDQIVAAGNDPRNWSLNKRYMMESLENGLDPSDPQRRLTLMEQQSHEYGGAMAKLESQERKETREPTIPIVEYESKVARNAPCPCGSGRKYKKCCGRSETTASDR
jgi:hypothetical protein